MAIQLILFSVVGSVNSSDKFGDTAKLFEAINEEELKIFDNVGLHHVFFGEVLAGENTPCRSGRVNP